MGCENLGSQVLDIYRKERDFKQLTLSDKNVVKYLILHRSKVDSTYSAMRNIDINQAGDTSDFNQELICLYASLDNVIGKIKINEKDKKMIYLLFEGNTVEDVIECYDYPRRTAYRILSRTVDKIVDENFKIWKDTYKLK